MRRAFIILAAGWLTSTPVAAEPLFSSVFQDHAVLQRDRPIPVWGAAAPGQAVQVQLGDAQVTVTAGADGRWTAALPARPAGGPLTLTARAGGQTQTLSDVLVGDVFLCSGQSNMEFPAIQATNGPSLVGAAADPDLRLLQVARRSRSAPQTSLEPGDRWQAATPASAANFSAACLFMGRELRRSQKVPIGLIHASWGGSAIQAWLSEGRLRTFSDHAEALAMLKEHQRSPAAGMARWSARMGRWADAAMPESRAWGSPDLDDSAWPTLTPGGFWEEVDDPAFRGFDGTAWFRTTVTLTAAQARQAATLSLGPIDDMDTTYLNGRLVGALEGWDTPRAYRLPAGALKAGPNVVAVRVIDTGGGGGLWGPPGSKQLTFADGSTVPLGPAWRYKVSRPVAETGPPPHMPWISVSGYSTLYSGMIAPLAPYGLKGVAWYQGEANVADPPAYARLLPALFADWRQAFGAPDLPFFVVQLADFGLPSGKPQDTAWARLREVQRRVVDADPHAGLAVAIDIGDPYDIHPTNKLDVGRRLARAARRVAYGEAGVETGPTPLAARREGERIVVSFKGASGGLVAYGNGRPTGFQVCDRAGRCRFVDAALAGDTVELAAGGSEASLVRYAWADSPVVNLFDGGGMPVVPFELSVD